MPTPDTIRKFYEKRGVKVRSAAAKRTGFAVCCDDPQRASDFWHATDESIPMTFYAPDPWYHRAWRWLRELARRRR